MKKVKHIIVKVWVYFYVIGLFCLVIASVINQKARHQFGEAGKATMCAQRQCANAIAIVGYQ